MNETSILDIQDVALQEAKIVLGLAGTSGSGKTFTALMLAYGMAGRDASKVAFLDTENRRSALYAKALPAPFKVGYLGAPFSPARYALALRELANSGAEVIVVDSMSHEWEGDGGCDSIAHAPKKDGTPRRMADWITAKSEHKKFMQTLLSMPCHVIACFRAKEKFNFANPEKPVSIGIQPICESNVQFEMTASFMMDNGGKTHVPIKQLPDFFSFLNHTGYFTIEDGEAIREWAGGVDPTEKLRNMLRLGAALGIKGLSEAWQKLTPQQKTTLETFKNTLKDQAKSADSERETVKGDNGAPEPDNQE